jgi:hypothetical protein
VAVRKKQRSRPAVDSHACESLGCVEIASQWRRPTQEENIDKTISQRRISENDRINFGFGFRKDRKLTVGTGHVKDHYRRIVRSIFGFRSAKIENFLAGSNLPRVRYGHIIRPIFGPVQDRILFDGIESGRHTSTLVIDAPSDQFSAFGPIEVLNGD